MEEVKEKDCCGLLVSQQSLGPVRDLTKRNKVASDRPGYPLSSALCMGAQGHAHKVSHTHTHTHAK